MPSDPAAAEIRYMAERMVPNPGIGEGDTVPVSLNRTVRGAIAAADAWWAEQAVLLGPLEWEDDALHGEGPTLSEEREFDASLVALGMTRDGEVQFRVYRWEVGP
jgi:hypothetical protein